MVIRPLLRSVRVILSKNIIVEGMKLGIIKKTPSGNTVFVPVCVNTFYITALNRAHSQHHFDGYLASVRLLGVVLLQNEISLLCNL